MCFVKEDLIISFALKACLRLNREGIQKHHWGILVSGDCGNTVHVDIIVQLLPQSIVITLETIRSPQSLFEDKNNELEATWGKCMLLKSGHREFLHQQGVSPSNL